MGQESIRQYNPVYTIRSLYPNIKQEIHEGCSLYTADYRHHIFSRAYSDGYACRKL